MHKQNIATDKNIRRTKTQKNYIYIAKTSHMQHNSAVIDCVQRQDTSDSS